MRRAGVKVTLSWRDCYVGSVRRVKEESCIFSSTRESHLVPAGTKSPSRPKRLVHGLRMHRGWRHEENRSHASSNYVVRCLDLCETRKFYSLYPGQKTEQLGNPRIPRRLPESSWPRPRHFCDRVVRADTARTAEPYGIVRHPCRGNFLSCGGRSG